MQEFHAKVSIVIKMYWLNRKCTSRLNRLFIEQERKKKKKTFTQRTQEIVHSLFFIM